MKKNLLLIISFLFLFCFSACGGESYSSSLNTWKDKIEDWQFRELKSIDNKDFIYASNDYVVDLATIIKIGNEIKNQITPKLDPVGNDYWQTSDETLLLGTGDCEDIAILIWRNLRNHGFPDDLVYLVVTEKNNQFHMILIVYYTLINYYIIDPTSYYIKTMIASNDYIEEYGINFLYSFNLFSLNYL